MDFDQMNRQLKGARRRSAVLFVFVGLLSASCVALASHIVTTTNQVVLVPSQISDGMVARGAVDQRYLEALALDAVYSFYNVSPQNLSYGRTSIERIAAGSQRAALLERYDEIGEDIRLRQISTTFRTNKLTTNLQNLQIAVEGTLATYIDTTRISEEARTIQVTFQQEGASVRVAGIGKVGGDS